MPALTNKNDNRYCCVPQCTVKAYKCPTLSFHGIPKDEQMKKLWLVRIRRDEGPLFRIRTWTRVCSRHFVPEDFRPPSLKGKQRRLKPDAVPSLFTWNNFQHPKERKQPAVRHPLSQANVNTDQSANIDAESATMGAKTAAVETVSNPFIKSKETAQGKDNCPIDAASSVPCQQILVSNQRYMVVAMGDLMKPFSIIYPAGPSPSCQEPISLHRNENNTSISKQYQTWTTTCDQQSADRHCTAEVSSDREEGAEQLETRAVKKEAEMELLSPHCFPNQGTVKRKGKLGSEVRLLQPKCEPQSSSTWEYSQYSVTDSQDYLINVINPAYIKKEPEDFETLSHSEPVKQIGNHSPGINTRAEILKPKSEEVPFLNMLHTDSIKKGPKDFETSWNVEREANTTRCSFESKIETEIYPTGLYHNVHYAQFKSGVHASDSLNEVSCPSDASNPCITSLHEIKAKDDANKLLCYFC